MKKLLLLLAIAAFCMPTWSADTKNLKYVDGTTLTIINKPQHDGNRLRRINTDKYPDLTSRVTGNEREENLMARRKMVMGRFRQS